MAQKIAVKNKAKPPVDSQFVDTVYLRDFVNFCKGDPLLTVWEAVFINDLSHRVYDYVAKTEPRPKIILSNKQVDIVSQISTKLGFDQENPPDVVIPSMDEELDIDEEKEEIIELHPVDED